MNKLRTALLVLGGFLFVLLLVASYANYIYTKFEGDSVPLESQTYLENTPTAKKTQDVNPSERSSSSNSVLSEDSKEGTEEKVASTSPVSISFIGFEVCAPSKCTVPETYVKNADRFLSERLGERYFLDNLLLNKQVVYHLSDGEENGKEWYTLLYVHTIFSKMNSNKRQTIVDVDIDARTGEIFKKNNNAPACRLNPDLCTVNVTKEQAIALAKENGLNVDSENFRFYVDFAKQTGKGWAWHLVENNAEETDPLYGFIPCWKNKSLEINISSGNLSQVLYTRVCENIGL